MLFGRKDAGKVRADRIIPISRLEEYAIIIVQAVEGRLATPF